MDVDKKVDRVVLALQHMPVGFEVQKHIDYLQQHIQLNTPDKPVDFEAAATFQVYGEDPTDHSGLLVQRFKNETLAIGLQGSAWSMVVKNDISAKMNETAKGLVVPMYRKSLEDVVRAQTNQEISFLELEKDVEFARAYMTKVLDPAFVLRVLMVSYASLDGQSAYPQAIAYVYERMRKTLVQHGSSLQEVPHDALLVNGVGRHPDEVAKRPLRDHWEAAAKEHQDLQDKNLVNSFLTSSFPVQWQDDVLFHGPRFNEFGESFASFWQMKPEWLSQTRALIMLRGDIPVDPVWRGGSTISAPGVALYNWLVDQKNQDPDLFSGQYPPPLGTIKDPNQPYHPPSDNDSCFAPGTLVRCKEGDAPIETIKANIQVMTHPHDSDHGYAISSSEQVMICTRPVNGGGKRIALYSFNEDKPFFTAGHVFITKGGRKAINPSIALGENPELPCSKLVTGDVVFRLDKEDVYEEITVTKVNMEEAWCDHVFGLHFSDGHHRYHANGYLVYMNYPQMTMDRLLKNYDHMEPKEQDEFLKSVSKLPQCYEKIFGETIFSAFKRAFSPGSHAIELIVAKLELAKMRTQDKLQRFGQQANRIQAHFQLMDTCHYNETSKKYGWDTTNVHSHSYNEARGTKVIEEKTQTSLTLPTLTLFRGTLLLDGKLCNKAEMTNREVEWSRLIPKESGNKTNHTHEHGVVKLNHHGDMLAGHVGYGTEDSVLTTFAVTAVPRTTDYILKAASDGGSTDSQTLLQNGNVEKDKLTWQPFWRLTTGVNTPNGPGEMLKATARLPDLESCVKMVTEAGQDVIDVYKAECEYRTPDVGPWKIVVTITGVEAARELMEKARDKYLSLHARETIPLFSAAEITIDIDTGEMSGWYTKLVPTEKGPQDASTGDQTGDDILNQIDSNKKNYKIEETYHLAKSNEAPHTFLMRRNVLSALSLQPRENKKVVTTHGVHVKPAIKPMVLLRAMTEEIRNVNLLKGITTTLDEAKVTAQAHLYLNAAAAYWRSDKETALFGDQKDSVKDRLPDDLKDLLDSDLRKFLGEEFSRRNFLQMLSHHEKYSKHFSSEEKKKLSYYWAGNNDACLSKGTCFNRIFRLCTRVAFKDIAPGIKPYIDDNEDWAQTYYSSLSKDDDMLNQLARASAVTGKYNRVKQHCCMLTALDKTDKGKYDDALYRDIMHKVYALLSLTATDLHEDETYIGSFIYATLLTLRDASVKAKETGTEDKRTQSEKDLGDAAEKIAKNMEENGVDLKKVDAINDAGELTRIIKDTLGFVARILKTRRDLVGQAPVIALEYMEKQYNNQERLGWKTKAKAFFKAGLPTAKLFMFAFIQAFQLAGPIMVLMKWDKLDMEQKVQAITTLVETGLRTVYSGAEAIMKLIGADADVLKLQVPALKFFQRRGAFSPQVDVMIGTVGGDTRVQLYIDGSVEEILTEEKSVLTGLPGGSKVSVADRLAETLGEKAPIWKRFSATAVILDSVTVIANVCVVVLLSIQIHDEIRDGTQSTAVVAIDVSTVVVLSLEATVGTVAIGLEIFAIECIALPYIGLVLALAGGILLVVQQFYPREEAPDAIVQYVKSVKDDAVKALVSPPSPLLNYNVTRVDSNDTTYAGKTYPQGYTTLTISVTGITDVKMRTFVLQFMGGTSVASMFLKPDVTYVDTPVDSSHPREENPEGTKVKKIGNNEAICEITTNDTFQGESGFTPTPEGTWSCSVGPSRNFINDSIYKKKQEEYEKAKAKAISEGKPPPEAPTAPPANDTTPLSNSDYTALSLVKVWPIVGPQSPLTIKLTGGHNTNLKSALLAIVEVEAEPDKTRTSVDTKARFYILDDSVERLSEDAE